MTRLLSILTLLFLNNISFGQTEVERDILGKIEIGYTTRWDIEQLFGNGELIDNHFLNPDNEQDQGKPGWIHSNGLFYKDKGIAFICADDGELISSIYFIPPFTLRLNNLTEIQIGQTPIRLAFPAIDTIKVNTTGASNYWSFSIDKYRFFVAKPIEHRKKEHYSEVPSFKDNIDYYKSQPISKVTIDLYDYEQFKQEFQEADNKLYCSRPLYAPKDVTHSNCFDLGWSDKVPTLMRPFYALTGGQKSERIKQGYWKEYGPNHKLIYEGKFKDNKEVGLFKYYDIEGNLERTETFSESKLNWIHIFALGLGAIILLVTIRKIKMKNAT
jgi:hypothetical protein